MDSSAENTFQWDFRDSVLFKFARVLESADLSSSSCSTLTLGKAMSLNLFLHLSNGDNNTYFEELLSSLDIIASDTHSQWTLSLAQSAHDILSTSEQGARCQKNSFPEPKEPFRLNQLSK